MTTNHPPLQNALQAAILNNGLAKPMSQQEIIWRAVKEMQPVKYHAIAKRTGIRPENVSSLLGQMEKRSMVYSRGAKGNGPTGVAREYLTDADTYKLLPKPDKKTSRPYVQPAPKPKTVIHLTKTTPVSVQTVQDVTQSNLLANNVDALTIAQARELWAILNKMFGRNE